MYDPKLHIGKESYVQPSDNAFNSCLICFFFACPNVTSDRGFVLCVRECWGESGLLHECKATDITLTQRSACKMSSLLAILRMNPKQNDKMT